MSSEQVNSKRKQRLEPLAYGLAGASLASSLSKRALSAAIRAGELRSYKRGRRRIIFRQDLEDFLRAGHATRSDEACA